MQLPTHHEHQPSQTWSGGEISAPYFSICIPQYGRYPFLIEQLRRLTTQSFRSFEVCISDGGSPEAGYADVLDFLDRQGMTYRYVWSHETLPYDINLRSSMALARGRFCMLMGNDDALSGPHTLQRLHDAIESHGPTGVVLSDFVDATTLVPARRIRYTQACGAGPDVAATHFRNFSFVSGIVLDRERAHAESTDRWDGSEMYQTYIGCRIIASGGALLEIDDVTVTKDLRLPGHEVDSYRRRPRLDPCPIEPRLLPLRLLGQVVVDAVRPYVRPEDYQRTVRVVTRQLIGVTYPYWLVIYREVQSWRYAAGIALGMRSRYLLDGLNPSLATRASTRVVYAAATAGGLLFPLALFGKLQSALYAIVKGARPQTWRLKGAQK